MKGNVGESQAKLFGLVDAICIEGQIGPAEEAAGRGGVDLPVTKQINQWLHATEVISMISSSG